MNASTPAAPEVTEATLTERVQRTPASLGGYHYHLEPGQRVFVLQTYQPPRSQEVFARCTCVANPAHRLSEDIFSVSLSSLKFNE